MARVIATFIRSLMKNKVLDISKYEDELTDFMNAFVEIEEIQALRKLLVLKNEWSSPDLSHLKIKNIIENCMCIHFSELTGKNYIDSLILIDDLSKVGKSLLEAYRIVLVFMSVLIFIWFTFWMSNR